MTTEIINHDTETLGEQYSRLWTKENGETLDDIFDYLKQVQNDREAATNAALSALKELNTLKGRTEVTDAIKELEKMQKRYENAT